MCNFRKFAAIIVSINSLEIGSFVRWMFMFTGHYVLYYGAV